MNQLFYNVAGEILHPKSDTNNGQHYLRSVCSVKRIVTALMPSLVSRCFSLFLPRLRILAKGKRSQNCLRFGIGGPSLYFYPLLSRSIIFFTVFTNLPLARKKKNSGEAICRRQQRVLSRSGARLQILSLIARLCHVINSICCLCYLVLT